eukprot:scpid105117/ scgid14649/ Ubiquitin-conjugating enzyme E2-17 kDa; Protein effete; Ubiquitin carrier protein; Ubiquitin-protein ligase
MWEAQKCLRQEEADFRDNPVQDLHAEPVSNDLLRWQASMSGPKGGPYEGGVFHLRINLSFDYPNVEPRVTFETKIYHPAVLPCGTVCPLCLARSLGNPVYNLKAVLQTVLRLLDNPHSCEIHLFHGVGNLHRTDPQLFAAIAKECTRRHAWEEMNQRAGG